MRALILVGGYGTRLRPLTLTVPKPCVEVCNKALMQHQIEALAAAGVTEVILAAGYQPEAIVGRLEGIAAKVGVRLVVSREDPDTPLGTAGPLGLARHLLEAPPAGPFFVLNSDVVCPFPLTQMLAYHKSRSGGGAAVAGTILVTRVADPSKYGVVVFDEGPAGTGRVARFVEKPKEFVGDKINAGVYVLEQSVLGLLGPPGTRMSIEREVFPKLAAQNALYAMTLEGFWADVGQPRDFLRGTELFLAWRADQLLKKKQQQQEDAKTTTIATVTSTATKSWSEVGNVLVDPTATIEEGAVLGPNVVVGAGCRVGRFARLRDTTLLPTSRVGDGARVCGAIIGWRSSVGRWCRIDEGTVLGENVHVADELHLNGAMVLPHKDIAASVPSPAVIM